MKAMAFGNLQEAKAVVARNEHKGKEAFDDRDDLDCSQPRKLGALQEAMRMEGAASRIEILQQKEHCESLFAAKLLRKVEFLKERTEERRVVAEKQRFVEATRVTTLLLTLPSNPLHAVLSGPSST